MAELQGSDLLLVVYKAGVNTTQAAYGETEHKLAKNNLYPTYGQPNHRTKATQQRGLTVERSNEKQETL